MLLPKNSIRLSLVSNTTTQEKQFLNEQRREIVRLLEDWLELPMLVLSFVWLALLVIELTWGISRQFEIAGTVIWIVFILDFAVKFTLAPHKLTYLKQNWLTAIALLVPALRVFRAVRLARLLRLARATRGLRLVRVITSLNRGMKALGATMQRRGFGYVAALTLLVTLAGAAGMYAFENQAPDGTGLNSYGTALWWTAMIMTTMGSDYWPRTAEGRVLCVVLALYAFAVFGYVMATLATFFIGRDAENQEAELAGDTSIKELRDEIASLRNDIQALTKSRDQQL
jgi:voltage-gated potassium channel